MDRLLQLITCDAQSHVTDYNTTNRRMARAALVAAYSPMALRRRQVTIERSASKSELLLSTEGAIQI